VGEELMKNTAGLIWWASWRSLIVVALFTALPLDTLGR
jgi:hypothetical protein